ncbi:glutamyl-tRNA amidotransferase subunit A [Xylariales sp. PMI_506]|nr:glutamyl-tRNA amidotransferase subunit A [Xylariales sp. PMI_506]
MSMTLADIGIGLDAGTFTVQDLTRTFLARIEEVNVDLHAVIEVNPDAMRIAKALDEELTISGRRGPLFGVPFLLKDNIVTAERMTATSGSLVLLGSKPFRESPVASKLRQAGAILLGSANLAEWGNFRSQVATCGWSPRGKQGYGAYYEKMDPAGSSSGSAVAVDVALCFAAIGTETQGSLIAPAEINNVVAIKPTVGLVSRDSVIPVSAAKDTVGPFARTVTDAAITLGVIAGRDSNDPATEKSPSEIPDYSLSCVTTDLKGMRLGVPRNALTKLMASILERFEEVLNGLRTLGADIIDVEFASVSEYRALRSDQKQLAMATEFRSSIKNYLANLKENPHNLYQLEDIYALTKQMPGEEASHRDLGIWDLALTTSTDSAEYQEAKRREGIFAGEGGILGSVTDHKLDAIIAPCDARIPNHFAAGGGLPMIAVPLGYMPEGTPIEWDESNEIISQAPNRPYGFGITGKAFSEETLLRVAFAVESLTDTRKSAQHYILPTSDLRDIVSRGV